MATGIGALRFNGSEATAPSGASYAAGVWTHTLLGGNHTQELTGLDVQALVGNTLVVKWTFGAGDYHYVRLKDAAGLGISLRLFNGASVDAMRTDATGTDISHDGTSTAVSPGTIYARLTFDDVTNPAGYTFQTSADGVTYGAGVAVTDKTLPDLSALTTLQLITYKNSNGTSTVEINPTVGATVTGVTVTPSSASVAVGSTTALAATVEGTGSPSQAVTWSSSDTGVATVNATTGVVTGVAEGSCTITATSDADAGFSDTCAVTVTAAPPATFPRQFQAATTPRTAANAAIAGRPIAWTSTDPAMATVTPSGVVTQLAAGGSIVATVRSGTRMVSVTTALLTT